MKYLPRWFITLVLVCHELPLMVKRGLAMVSVFGMIASCFIPLYTNVNGEVIRLGIWYAFIGLFGVISFIFIVFAYLVAKSIFPDKEE